MFLYTLDNKRYHTLNYFYQNKFHCKVFKISLNASFSCPNKDGTSGTGGCIFCSKSGSGDFAGNAEDDLITQFYKIKDSYKQKWPQGEYIGYFQANTNTYASVSTLKKTYEPILVLDHVIGLSIATRPDAITEECLDYLEDLSKRTFLTIELGLQTIHEKTSILCNRGHTLECFDTMVNKLRKRNINVVVHIINGLPYETKKMMLETIDHLNQLDIQGIKIHMLHILKKTALAKLYQDQKFPVLTKKEYVDIVCDQLERLRPEIVIHRITGDPDKESLIEPKWLLKKFCVLNEIDKELLRRNTYQGFLLTISNRVHQIMDTILKKTDYVIDVFGNDTLYLSNIVTKGKIFIFANPITSPPPKQKCIFYHQSYKTIPITLKAYLGKISLITLNLTHEEQNNHLIELIRQMIPLLNQKGILLITVDPKKENGLKESALLNVFIRELNTGQVKIYHNTNILEDPYLITIANTQNKRT